MTDLLDRPDPDLTVPLPLLGEDDRPSGWRGFTWDVRQYRIVRQTPYGLTPLMVLGLIGFFQRFDSAAFSLASPDIARELNISVGDIIGIQAIVGTIATVALLFAGYYADRHRRVPFVSIGTLVSGVFSAVTGRAHSFVAVATPRVIDDVADVASGVPQFSLTADYYPPAVRGRVFALLGLFSKVAALISPVLVGYCIVEFGWRTSFIVFGIPLIVLGVAAQVLLKEPIRGYQERKAMGASEEIARVEDEPLSFAEGVPHHVVGAHGASNSDRRRVHGWGRRHGQPLLRVLPRRGVRASMPSSAASCSYPPSLLGWPVASSGARSSTASPGATRAGSWWCSASTA